MSDLLIRNIRPMAGLPADILIRGGKIAAIGPALVAEAATVEDGRGFIAIPGLVDTHTHLDKTTWGMGWYTGRKGGSLQDLIDNERNSRRTLGLDVHRQSMRHAIQLIENGAGHIRVQRGVAEAVNVWGIFAKLHFDGRGVAAPVASHLVDLVEHHHAVARAGLAQR